MKRYGLLLCVLLSSLYTLHAQDTLVKRNGERVLVKVLEVNLADIRYKRFANQDGPLYTLSKTEVDYIVYPNGIKESYRDIKAAAPLQPSAPVQSPPPPYASSAATEYRLKGRPMTESAMLESMKSQKNPNLHLLILKTEKARTAQYLFGAAGLCLGVVSTITIVSTATSGYLNSTVVHDREMTSLILAELALTSEVASICFKIERKKHLRETMDAYNKIVEVK
jgi:hypothetical protein